MTLRSKSAGMMSRLRHPKATVRWRLTLLYGGLFLVSGAALLGVTYTLVSHATVTSGPELQRAVTVKRPPKGTVGPLPDVKFHSGKLQINGPPSAAPLPRQVKNFLGSSAGRAVFVQVGSKQRIADLHQLVLWSSIALAMMAVISAALGWIVAGRVLRPLRTMTATTQQISEANLHERLALQGPRDELRKLADTIDGLLERLEGAFDAQRRFVANASHELRTPLTAARALLEMVITDPHATVATFRTACEQVLEESEEQEQLIDALLALAHGQRGIDRREPVDLAGVAAAVVHAQELEAAARGLRLDASLGPATLAGDRRLIERLASNLVENAIHHNTAGGWIRVVVETRAGEATLGVANSGPVVPADEVDRLLQPFQRLAADRVGHRDGLGLGLSIVSAIAGAHDAALEVHPVPDGGLDVEVRFPPAPQGERPAPPGARSREPERDDVRTTGITAG